MERVVVVGWMLVALVVAGCGARADGSVGGNQAAGGDTVAAAGCAVTAPVTWRPPDAPGRSPLAEGPYFRSADGRLGTADQGAWRTGGMKVLWLKPVGSRLQVNGRRLDGDAPPLRADLFGPRAYAGDFEASGVYFPTAGCWAVEARADGSVLRFVVAVG